MKAIKIINNLNIVNNGKDCLLEALALFSYIIESKDIDVLINKIAKSEKYDKNVYKYEYINIINKICKISNSPTFHTPMFNNIIHNLCDEFRRIPNFDKLNFNDTFIDSGFLTDETVLFNSTNDGDIHIQLIHDINHYYVVVIAGNDIYLFDSIKKQELKINPSAHNILHFIYSGTNLNIIQKIESLNYVKYSSNIKIPDVNELAIKLYSLKDVNNENEFNSLFNQNLIVNCK